MVGQLLDLVIFHPLQLLGSRLAQAAAQQGQQGILHLDLEKSLRSPLAFASVQECGLFLQGTSQQHFTYPPGWCFCFKEL